jgi:hypothetical protein
MIIAIFGLIFFISLFSMLTFIDMNLYKYKEKAIKETEIIKKEIEKIIKETKKGD